MYEEIYEQPPNLYWERLNSNLNHAARGQRHQLEYKYRDSVYGFRCRHCQAYVYTQPAFSGVQNRNHCPFCLWSRHVDLQQAGDRMSACKAVMQPVGLTLKRSRNKYGIEKVGELMVIHLCSECGKTSINRLAADDTPDVIMGIYQGSLEMDGLKLTQLEAGGIRILQAMDVGYVQAQLYGQRQN